MQGSLQGQRRTSQRGRPVESRIAETRHLHHDGRDLIRRRKIHSPCRYYLSCTLYHNHERSPGRGGSGGLAPPRSHPGLEPAGDPPMKSMWGRSVSLPVLVLTLIAPAIAQQQKPWTMVLDERLPLYGHRNWIVIADSAYPLQSAPGIET